MSVSISAPAPAPAPLFTDDPILSKMEDSNILWGDLFAESSPPAPNLSKKKAIAKHYPVRVKNQTDGSIGIQWNINKLAEWRVGNSNPLEWKYYETKTAIEMIDNLRNSGWIVSAPHHPSFICSIKRCSNSTQISTWKYEEPDCPIFICLNDIKLFFPVIWHKIESNCKMYSIELYHDKIRNVAQARGVSPEHLTSHLSSLLVTTLAQSPAWTVLNSQIMGEQCRLLL